MCSAISSHPQLTGFKVWAAAHLLVNGDLASILLFGGLLAWAVVEVIFSKRVPGLVNRDSAPISSPIVHLGLVVVAFGVVAGIHDLAWRLALRMTLYRFLTGDDSSAFCHKVSEALSKGWTLYGDPTYAFDASTGQMRCGQAVIKDVDADYHPDMKLGDQ